MEASAEGIRALWVSLAVLGGTAVLQAAVVAISGSVALLGDTLHNAADALTAVPLGIAFVVGRRPPTRRYTYGYGRAEDLAGVVIVVVIAASSALAGYEAVTRLAHPRPVSNLIAVAVAAVIGFTGNEVVARYRIRVGRKIGSAALVADGLHARTDGFTSLAVLLGVAGVAIGWDWAESRGWAADHGGRYLAVLRQAAREIYRRLMDAVDPALVDQVEQTLRATPGVLGEARSGCARWATICALNARLSSMPVPARSRRTGSRSTPSTTCFMRCRGWPPRWCTPTRRPRQAMIIMLFWLPIGGKARCGWPAVVLCEVVVASALGVIGRQVLRSDCGRAGR